MHIHICVLHTHRQIVIIKHEDDLHTNIFIACIMSQIHSESQSLLLEIHCHFPGKLSKESGKSECLKNLNIF